VLEGEGWIDIASIGRLGSDESLPFAWVGDDSWEVVVPLSEGDNDITLEALDRHGERVGSDQIRVERIGG
jgi:hypothetical protein